MSDINVQNRPLHLAYLRHKVPCPHITCRSESGRIFFDEKGLAQHFRVKQAGVIFKALKHIQETWPLFKYLHGEETKQNLIRLFVERQQVSVYNKSIVFLYFTVYLALNSNIHEWLSTMSVLSSPRASIKADLYRFFFFFS